MIEKIKKYDQRIGFSEKGREYTYAQIIHMIRTVQWMIEAERKQEIGICMSHGIRYAVYMLAAVEAGCHVYLLHPNIRSNTLEFLEKRHVMIYTDDVTYLNIKELYPDDCLYRTEPTSVNSDRVSKNSKDFMANIILTTSGTTSTRAKFVSIPFNNIMLKSEMIADYFAITNTDKTLLISPLCFVQSVWAMLIHLVRGGNVYFDTFKPRYFNEILRENKITTLITTPSVIRGIIKENQSSYFLRLLSIGGDFMDKKLLEELKEKWPDVSYANVYGATETCAGDAIFIPRKFCKMDPTFLSLGKPTRYSRIFITDECDNLLEPGQEGIICIQSPFLIDHYYQTDTLIRNEKGYFKTYDIGYIDREGFLFYRGRASSIIVYNGEKISSYEIENLIYQIEGVKENVVIGEKHEVYGQIPVAYIVADERINEDVVRNFLRSRLEKYKVPRKIVFRYHLIYTNSGKLIRKESVYEIQKD